MPPVSSRSVRIASALVIVLLVGGIVSAAPAAAQPRVEIPTVQTHEIEAKSVDQTFRVQVSLPPRMAGSSDRYGVLYVTDMSAPMDAVADAIHLMGFTGEMPQLIVVGIGYRADSIVQTLGVRARDLTPVEDPQLLSQGAMASLVDGWVQSERLSGGADDFLRFFHEELFPFVDERYPTSGERAYFGDSLGGLFGLYALLERPETFSRYIIGSPSIWVGNEWLLGRAEEYVAEHDDLDARVFVAVGGNEETGPQAASARMVTNVGRIETILGRASFPSLRLSTHIFPDESHLSVVYMNLFRGLHKVFDPAPSPWVAAMSGGEEASGDGGN